MAFSETWFLLEQEGLLTQACLYNGQKQTHKNIYF